MPADAGVHGLCAQLRALAWVKRKKQKARRRDIRRQIVHFCPSPSEQGITLHQIEPGNTAGRDLPRRR